MWPSVFFLLSMKAYAFTWLFLFKKILQSAIRASLFVDIVSSTIEKQLSELETARTCFTLFKEGK